MNKSLKIFLIFIFICLIYFLWLLKTVHHPYTSVEQIEPFKTCPKIISVVKGGNLGNRIFEYMSLFSVAHLYNRTNLVPYCTDDLRSNLDKIFENITIRGKHSSVPKHCYDISKSYVWPLSKIISTEEIIKVNRSITLAMYSARYEEIIQCGLEKVREELRFRQEHIDDINGLLTQLSAKYNWTNDVTYVGMHYRGTDYIHHLKITYKLYRDPPTYKYYNEAMDYFKKRYKKVIFILLTIDQEWLEENLPKMQNDTHIIANPSPGDAVRHMVLLARCNHTIINYGTYGATAALLNGGTTFVYDLDLPLDHRGPTIGVGIAKILPNWHVLQ